MPLAMNLYRSGALFNARQLRGIQLQAAAGQIVTQMRTGLHARNSHDMGCLCQYPSQSDLRCAGAQFAAQLAQRVAPPPRRQQRILRQRQRLPRQKLRVLWLCKRRSFWASRRFDGCA
jgi:hypothetical protein